MAYQLIETNKNNNWLGAGSTEKLWSIRVGSREWRLETAARDGKVAWSRIWEATEGAASRAEATVTIRNGILPGDKKPEAQINWPSIGAVGLEEALAFKRSIGEAAQAATDAQHIIDYEAVDLPDRSNLTTTTKEEA